MRGSDGRDRGEQHVEAFLVLLPSDREHQRRRVVERERVTNPSAPLHRPPAERLGGSTAAVRRRSVPAGSRVGATSRRRRTARRRAACGPTEQCTRRRIGLIAPSIVGGRIRDVARPVGGDGERRDDRRTSETGGDATGHVGFEQGGVHQIRPALVDEAHEPAQPSGAAEPSVDALQRARPPPRTPAGDPDGRGGRRSRARSRDGRSGAPVRAATVRHPRAPRCRSRTAGA